LQTEADLTSFDEYEKTINL